MKLITQTFFFNGKGNKMYPISSEAMKVIQKEKKENTPKLHMT